MRNVFRKQHKKQYLLLKILLVFLMSGTNCISAQTAISIKASVLSYNFLENSFPYDYKLNLSNNGQLSVEPGFLFSYERFLTELPLSVRLNQGIGIDVAGKLTGVTQCKLHLSVFRQWKSAVNISAGIGFFYRKKWNDIDQEENIGYSELTPDSELSDYLFSAAIEYNYSLNKNTDFSISLNHFNKYNVQLLVGFRFWISKDKKRRYKCLTCPDF